MSETTAQRKPRRRRSFLRRYERRIVGWSIPLMLVVLLGAGMGRIANSNAADGIARDTALKSYAQQLAQNTHNAITIHVKQKLEDASPYYTWESSAHTLTVTVQLSACAISGVFVNVPRHPTVVEQLGELQLVVSSTNSKAEKANIPVTAPNLYAALMASGLAHCVAGDKRLQPAGG